MLGLVCLESEEQQEGHHQTEQTHGFRQGESQDSVREQLLLERWVSGVTDDEGTEYCSDTSTCGGNFRIWQRMGRKIVEEEISTTVTEKSNQGKDD